MSLNPGQRLGPYEIVAFVGAGGMGEVYRARDARLERDVAIKTLTSASALDPERLARFEQEARAAAALNHPNIIAVHDIGTIDGTTYVVSELLDGETLRDALADGALPARQTISYAVQLAHGLAAAHERSIVHRDLKPENIFVTRDGRVKILDFGLAKLVEPSPGASATMLPTAAVGTVAGMVLGTIGYMAPEQVRGLPVDHRADIFAFGAVLYEMLTGSRAFGGATTADTLSAILKDDPAELTAAASKIPPPLQRVVQRCLEKKPEVRFHSAHDLAYAVEAAATYSTSGAMPALEGPAAPVPRAQRWIWLAGALAVAAIAAIVVTTKSGDADEGTAASVGTVRFVAPLPPGTYPATGPAPFAISPDGRQIVVVLQSDTDSGLWVRSLDAFEMRRIPGSEGAGTRALLWSPDGKRIAFGAAGALKFIPIEGGAAQTVCRCPGAAAAWSRDDTIILVNPPGPLQSVKVSDGLPVPLTQLGADETAHTQPSFFADDRRFLFVAAHQDGSTTLHVTSLDGGPVQTLKVATATAALSGDFLVYARERSIVAQRFDQRTLEIHPEQILLADDVRLAGGGGGIRRANFSVARERSVLGYQSGRDRSQLTWFDRGGSVMSTVADPGTYSTVALSRDDSKIAFGLADQQDAVNVWVWDLARGVRSRLTSGTVRESDPAWSPTGDRIALNSIRPDGKHLFLTSSAGGELELLLRSTGGDLAVDDWSRDGRYVLYHNNAGMHAIELFGERKSFVVSHPEARQPDEGAFSPDGKSVAYNSGEVGGRSVVFLKTFPPTDEKWPLSNAGGVQPRWRQDGRELYYLAPDGTMMVVEIQSPPPNLKASPPRPLFKTRLSSPNPRTEQYAVRGDGARFLIMDPIVDERQIPLRFVLGWNAER